VTGRFQSSLQGWSIRRLESRTGSEVDPVVKTTVDEI